LDLLDRAVFNARISTSQEAQLEKLSYQSGQRLAPEGNVGDLPMSPWLQGRLKDTSLRSSYH